MLLSKMTPISHVNGICMFLIAISIGSVFFIGGYNYGYKVALSQSLQEIQKESFAQEVYANTLFMNSNDQQQAICEGTENNHKAPASMETESQKFTARLMNYPIVNRKNALQFIERWKKKGVNLILEEYRTVTNQKKLWLKVLIEPHTDKNQIELLASLIGQEEKLTNVVIELYQPEEIKYDHTDT